MWKEALRNGERKGCDAGVPFPSERTVDGLFIFLSFFFFLFFFAG